MAISNFTLNRIYLDYKNELEGVKISKIVKISDYDFSFILFSNKQKSLIISLSPLHPYFLISLSYFKTLNETNMFISLLKKYFENGTIIEIKKVPNDRIVIFKIKKITPTYQTIINSLIIELIPHRTNAIIVDENNVIISALKLSSSLDEERLIAKGVHYSLSQNEDKNITKSDNLETLKSKIGITLYKDIIYRIEKENASLKEIIEEILTSEKYFLYNNDVLSIKLHSFPCQEITLDKLSDIYKQIEAEKYKKDHFNMVYHLVTHKLKGLRNKLVNLEKDYQKNLSKKSYVDIGNLLFINQSSYQKGSKEITIDGQVIALDEKLSLVENANRYFKQYQKSKVALVELSKQIELTKNKIEFFEKIENQIEFATLKDMEDIISELVDNGYIKSNIKKKNPKKILPKSYNPHYITIDGYKIGFGLSSYQNDYLTFTLARKDDYFFHIKDSHGPHVVIFSSSPSKEAILFACEIALFFAKKESGEIFLCDKKDVKKIPGKIGMVSFNNYQTISLKQIREQTKLKLSNLTSED